MGGIRKMADGSYGDEVLPVPMSAQAPTIAISGTSTASASTPLPGVGNIVRLVNEGTNNCYVSIGPDGQVATVPSSTAASTCTPILAGEDASFSIPNAQMNISIICRAAQTCTLIVSVGEGV